MPSRGQVVCKGIWKLVVDDADESGVYSRGKDRRDSCA